MLALKSDPTKPDNDNVPAARHRSQIRIRGMDILDHSSIILGPKSYEYCSYLVLPPHFQMQAKKEVPLTTPC